MARKSWSDVGGVAHEIIKGEHDDDLSYIHQACGQRLKMLFRKGARVRFVDTGNPLVDGMEGRVMKANTKTISVRLDDGREYNATPGFLELVVGDLVRVQ